MNTSTETFKVQVPSQKSSARENDIAKEGKIGNESVRMNVVIAGVYAELSETIISILLISGALVIYKLAGLHGQWVQFIERLIP